MAFPVFLAGSIVMTAVQRAFDDNPETVSFDTISAQMQAATIASVNVDSLEAGQTPEQVIAENESFQKAIELIPGLMDQGREFALASETPFLFALGNAITGAQIQAGLMQVLGPVYEPIMLQLSAVTGAKTRKIDIDIDW